MKFEANTENTAILATSGMEDSDIESFAVEESSHMFDILSSQLYSYPVRAILREVGCNARDAHIMSGIASRAIQVSLPTVRKPVVSIRDFGNGLSPEDIKKVYLRYGKSLKQQNNETTGAFGLGCKSPFAYVQRRPKDCSGFIVRSAHKGLAVTYFMFLGEDGGPKSREMGRTEVPLTDQGITVEFTVAQEDIRLFHDEAQYVFAQFDVAPEFVESGDFQLKPLVYDYEGKHYGLRRDSTRPSCVTGCVEYPIEMREMGVLTPVQDALLKVGITLRMDVGTVMMTPSREQLRYTETTKNHLKAGLDRAAQEIKDMLTKLIFEGRASMTSWEWRCKLYEFYQQLPRQMQGVILAMLSDIVEDEKEAESIKSSMVNGEIRLTIPVGRGDIREVRRVADLNADGTPKTDANGMVIQVEKLEEPGARVFYFSKKDTRRGTGVGVAKTRVLNGKLYIPRENKSNPIFFRCVTGNNVLIAYGNSSYAEARVRHAMMTGNYSGAYLFMPQKGGTKEEAKAHAELMLTQKELQGLTLVGTDTIAYTAASRAGGVRAAADRTTDNFRLRKGETWEEAVAELTIPLLRVGETEVEEVLMGELEDSDKYYLICPREVWEDDATPRSKAFWSSQAATVISPSYNNRGRECLNIAHELLNDRGGDITGVVFVESAAQLKRLQLEENGFQPYWNNVVSWIRDYVAPYLRENIRVDISYAATQWTDGDLTYADWPTWLLRQTYRNTEHIQQLWNIMEHTPNGRTLREHVDAVLGVTRGRDGENAAQAPDHEVQQALQRQAASLTRLNSLLSCSVATVESRNQTRQPRMLTEGISKTWNNVQVLEFRRLRAMFEDDNRRNFAISMLTTAVNSHQNVEVDENLQDAITRHFGEA